MTNTDLKILAKGLFLNQEHLRVLGGYKDQRTIRRMMAGDTPVHQDLADKLIMLDRDIDKTVSYAVNLSLESGADSIYIAVYSEQADYQAYSDNSLPLYELHQAMVFRLKKSLERFGISVVLKSFNESDYLAFLKSSKLTHSSAAVSAFSAIEK